MEQPGSIICKNCGNSFQGNYCSNCRQPAETHRITWHEVGHNFFHAFFHADRGLLYTIREMTLHPGIAIREYLGGKRAYHFNPLLFLILSGTLATLLFSYLHLRLINVEVVYERIEAYNSFIAHKYFIFVGFFFIVLLTVTDFIFYFNKKYILPELIISNAYQIGQLLLFTVLMVPLFVLQNYILENPDPIFELRTILKIGVLCFLFFTRYQLYEAKGNYLMITKIFIQIVLVYVLYSIIVTKLVVNWMIGS